MVQVQINAKIYIVCHVWPSSGGPEALHQLCHALNSQGYSAFMYYIPEKSVQNDMEIHPAYAKYHTVKAYEIIDEKQNIIIVPEAATNYLYKYKKIKKIIYWLSVDNYYKSIEVSSIFKRLLKNILQNMGYYKFFNIANYKRTDIITHLVQSKYAEDHLKKFGINSLHVSDYINEEYLNRKVSLSATTRTDEILYNPLKGYEITSKLMELAPELKWTPLIGLTPIQVADKLSKSKVYIDFGAHPGKDRFPREAAMMGCCIITGKKGSAGFYEDIPIDGKYKFDNYNFEEIITMINYCLKNFDIAVKDFNNYREFITNHKPTLYNQISEIFVKIP